MEKTYAISGLKCQGCVETVTQKLTALKAVDAVKVDLDKHTVTVSGKVRKFSLDRALKGSKFKLGKRL